MTTTTDGQRIVREGKRVAPVLNVRFRCPECQREIIIDAYHGPVTCKSGHAPKFFYPLTIVRGENEPGPLDDIEALRKTERGYAV